MCIRDRPSSSPSRRGDASEGEALTVRPAPQRATFWLDGIRLAVQVLPLVVALQCRTSGGITKNTRRE
eukprot:10999867-Alexandrium_andersonii.AAC.1